MEGRFCPWPACHGWTTSPSGMPTCRASRRLREVDERAVPALRRDRRRNAHGPRGEEPDAALPGGPAVPRRAPRAGPVASDPAEPADERAEADEPHRAQLRLQHPDDRDADEHDGTDGVGLVPD